MRKRRWIARIALAIAIAITLTFALSMIAIFGVATHRSDYLSWHTSTDGFGLFQFVGTQGQLILRVDTGNTVRPRRVPRAWHAGMIYSRGISTDLRMTDRRITKLGFDAYYGDTGMVGIGVFGLYPTIIAWGLVWWTRRTKAHAPGHCPSCGYDMRATPARCPECGMTAELDRPR